MRAITTDDVTRAAETLSRSDRGRVALRALDRFFDDGGLSLDSDNQYAFLTLVIAAFGSFPGSTREAISEVLE